MATVHLYTRHSNQCPKRDDPNWRRCQCWKWVSYTHEGQHKRESTKKRDWAEALQVARDLEDTLKNGKSRLDKLDTSIPAAVFAFLESRDRQALSHSTRKKDKTWFENDLLKWCSSHRVDYVRDLTLERLEEWRSSWKTGASASSYKQQAIVRFFEYCIARGWLLINPAEDLSKPVIKESPQTEYFSDGDVKKILEGCEGTPLHALASLMRWSGLAILDAVTLERSALDAAGHVLLRRTKTKVPVFVLLQENVAKELRELPVPLAWSPRYFFWKGDGKRDNAALKWGKEFKSLFDRIKLKHEDGTLKSAHPHMFRHTFAVNCLLAGMPIYDLSILLGHKSVKTTEKHYAQFVRERQVRLDQLVKSTWDTQSAQGGA